MAILAEKRSIGGRLTNFFRGLKKKKAKAKAKPAPTTSTTTTRPTTTTLPKFDLPKGRLGTGLARDAADALAKQRRKKKRILKEAFK